MIETYRNDNVSKITRFDTLKQADKWIARNQDKYDKEIKIGTNIKDGFVVYYDR